MTKSRIWSIALLCCALFCAVFTFTATADDGIQFYYWNVASGNWSDPANWDVNSLPDHHTDSAYVTNGGTITIDTDIATTDISQIRVHDGNVNQDAYSVEMRYLVLGLAGATGAYNFSGGTLNVVSSIHLGQSHNGIAGHGHFNMTGGALNAENFLVGYDEGSSGLFEISGGIANILNDFIVGERTTMGNAVVNQSGGSVFVAEHLRIGIAHTNFFVGTMANGIYSMSGGTLDTVGNLYVGSRDVDDVTGSYIPEYASDGRLFFTGGHITVRQSMYVYHPDSYINDSAAPGGVGGTIDLWNDFRNYSEARLDFDMRHTTVILHGGEGWDGTEWDLKVLDMNSVDYGASVAGLDINFAIGNLVFSGQPGTSQWYRLESDIYCYGLSIEDGAIIDLNGYNIYYMPHGSYSGISAGTVQLAGIWGNMECCEYGDILEIPNVPEPGTIILIGSGVLALAGVARKRLA